MMRILERLVGERTARCWCRTGTRPGRGRRLRDRKRKAQGLIGPRMIRKLGQRPWRELRPCWRTATKAGDRRASFVPLRRPAGSLELSRIFRRQEYERRNSKVPVAPGRAKPGRRCVVAAVSGTGGTRPMAAQSRLPTEIESHLVHKVTRDLERRAWDSNPRWV
jgi:hypothetical protein